MSRQGKIFLIVIFLIVLGAFVVKFFQRPQLLGEEGSKVMCDHCEGDGRFTRHPADKFPGQIDSLHRTAKEKFKGGNYLDGISLLREAAELGDVESQVWLGEILFNHPRYTDTSVQLVKDCSEAKKWLDLAANEPDTDKYSYSISQAKESLKLWQGICEPDISKPKAAQ